MEQERADENQLVANAIGEEAEEDDGESHAGESATGDRAKFGLSETEQAATTAAMNFAPRKDS